MEQQRTPRMTIPTQLVLRALLADPAKELYGVEIGTTAGLPSGTVHPILARLEGVGWLTSPWEDVAPRAEGRPAPRYYPLTPHRSARLAATPGRTVMSALMGPGGPARWANPPGGPALWSAPPPCPCR